MVRCGPLLGSSFVIVLSLVSELGVSTVGFGFSFLGYGLLCLVVCRCRLCFFWELRLITVSLLHFGVCVSFVGFNLMR